ncbi:fimbrial protein [Bordetella petrii]|uniref:Type-1 fimbrial protein n=1 Tax=Bordetella petrii (strain ATCC BAA-461 / DSM 12804 / CCUG 43448 / CIP 107267 / Se-1111R) TaxID=340100 RepID=A9IDE6_BORPD|nr:fimbrial protein [Bordetella petrii]CAP44815.1 type-1 fimbrial protein [Bordetella petrii]
MKTPRTACLVASIALLANTPSAWAQGGNVTFTGAVVAESCEIGGGHPAVARSLSPRFTVDLPAIGTDTLTTHGQTAGWSPFAITLRHCGNRYALVRTHFEPGAFVDMATGRLSPDSHSSAGNVQIALRELGRTRHILIGAPPGSQGSTPVVLQGHATQVYEAGYYALGQVSPGTVHTSVEYNLVYQ